MLDDKYRVERLLAMGGMGAVYLGTHTKLRKRVAIKILNPALSSKAMIERFHREAITASQVGHEGIAQVTDLGTSTEREPFLVMEYLEGESLGQRLETGGALSVEAACEIGCGILAPLYAAHQAGVVHRDLKPDNVFLVRRSRGESVKLLDFGISRSVGLESEFRLTKTGLVLGTPYYMSPEQARGENEVSPAADLYAFGVILYEMVVGRVPITGDNYNELMYRVLTAEFEPPRARRPELPEELERIILQAMALRPGDRPASADALEQQLLSFCRPTFRAHQLDRLSSSGLLRPASEASQPAIPLGDSAPVLVPAPGSAASSNALNALAHQRDWGGTTESNIAATPPGAAPPGATPPAPSAAPALPAADPAARAARDPSHLTPDPFTASLELAAPPRSRKMWLVGAAVVALGAVGAAAAIVATRDRGAPSVTPDARGSAPPTASSASSAVAPLPSEIPPPIAHAPPPPPPALAGEGAVAAAAAEITLAFAVQPARAAISLDGAPVKGGTITVPRDGAPHKLRVALAGFVPYEEEVRFDESRAWTIRLERATRPSPAPPRGSRKERKERKERPDRDKLDKIEMESPYR